MAALSFALDENVSRYVAGLLRSVGQDVRSATELGRLGLSDVQVLLRATEHNQTVITHNGKDFEALHEAWVIWRRRWMAEAEVIAGIPVTLSQHAGIVIIPQLSRFELVRILSDFASTMETIDGQLFSWSHERGWDELRL